MTVVAEPKGDPFAVLGLPRAYGLDAADLERRFRERSREVHPDRFARAPAHERRAALAAATALNDAYRALRDPLRRAEHLLALAGAPAVHSRVADPEFLEAQLELRERLASARRAGDARAAAEVAAEAAARLAAIDADLARLLAGAPRAEDARAAADALGRARFYASLAADAAGR